MSTFRIRKIIIPKNSNNYVIEKLNVFLFFKWWSVVNKRDKETSWPLYFDNLKDAELELNILKSNK